MKGKSIIMDCPCVAPFLVFRTPKALHTTSHNHTQMAEAAVEGANCTSESHQDQIWGSIFLLKDTFDKQTGEAGIKPPTF